MGAPDFSAALDQTHVNTGILALEGAVWLALGFAFILVSLIVLPALRASRIETAGIH